MYKKYVEHIQSKPPHHRRQHAMQVAGTLTVLAFVIWIGTLGMRFGTPPQGSQDPGSVQADTDAQQTQLAGADASGDTSQSGLEVVGTSTDSTYSNY